LYIQIDVIFDLHYVKSGVIHSLSGLFVNDKSYFKQVCPN
jgi:hypothetical protein